jgi:hypothetical protein
VFSAASADEPFSETEQTRFQFDGGEGAFTFIPELAWANRVQQRKERAPDILIRERDCDRAIEKVRRVIPGVGRPRRNPRCSRSRYGMWRRISN